MHKLDLIKAWLLIMLLAFSANGSVSANIASGLQNLRLDAHQGESVVKPLMRQEKTQVSTMAASDIFIEEDKETGLLYAKARYYDADTGKFLSEDAWEGDHMIAPSLHKYLYAYQNPTVWIDPTGLCPTGQIGYVGGGSAGCRDPINWGERNPITASIIGPMSSVAFRRNGNLYDPINKRELTGKQAFDAKFNTLFTALPASKAKALSSAASRLVGAQATKIKDAAAPFVNKANEIAGPAIRATKDQVGRITKPIANAIPNKLKPSSWNFNPSARFDELVAEQARQRAKPNAGGANLVEESADQVQPISSGLRNDLDGGGSFLMTEEQFKKFAAPALNDGRPVGRPDGQFMTSAKEMNKIINETGGNSGALGKKLGVDDWEGQPLVRMDVENPNALNPRLPDSSVGGANENFISGGQTSGGVPELVTDPIPANKLWPTKIEVVE